jgi:hypothetical protein
MRKINTVLLETSQFNHLAINLAQHQLLQQYWHACTPQIIYQHSHVAGLDNGLLSVYADSALVVSKIKLTQVSILTQLQHTQLANPSFRECKVTAINVKVQVVSKPIVTVKRPRKLTAEASKSLKKLADNLGESALGTKMRILASKI